MNLNHLRAFVKVVQTKSYKDAANLLSVSQPAITQRIQLLDEHFKTKLLKRNSEGIELTSKGEIAYKQSQAILNLWDELERQLLSDKPLGKLTVGASTIPSEYLLPGIIKRFITKYPDVYTHMCVSGSHEVVKWLINHSVDVIITGKVEEDPTIFSLPIVKDELKIIAPIDSYWSDKKNHFSKLLDLQWVLREPESNTRRVWEEELFRKGYDINSLKIAGQMGSTEAVIAAVEAGMGISVVSTLAAERAVSHNRVKIIYLEGLEMSRTFYISCLKENINNPVISSFLSFLKENEI